MIAEISYDFVMEEEMSLVEGTYRLPEKEWQVFIFGPLTGEITEPRITVGKWDSGVTGVFIEWPRSATLNKAVVEATLSKTLGVTTWKEVKGPDSIVIR